MSRSNDKPRNLIDHLAGWITIPRFIFLVILTIFLVSIIFPFYWMVSSSFKTYAEIGGCYYAARFAVNELLNKENRQASVVILREAHPGYILPVGVWNVRESVRKALKGDYRKFDTLNGAILFISEIMDIPIERWIKNSAILKNHLYQKKIEDF